MARLRRSLSLFFQSPFGKASLTALGGGKPQLERGHPWPAKRAQVGFALRAHAGRDARAPFKSPAHFFGGGFL